MRTPAPACVALLACAVGACRWTHPAPRAERLAELQREHERLRQRLESLAVRDPLLSRAEVSSGDLVVGIRSALVADMIREVVQRYLDQVVLDLEQEIHVREEREVKARTFLGTIKAGTWRLDLTLHRVQGLLRAKPPRVDFAGTNRIGIGLPVRLEGAHWKATLGFAWDATAAASVVCGDFEFRRPIEGAVLPQEYPLAGAVLLSAGADALAAEPTFPERRFRVRVDLTPASWDEVGRFLNSQDTLLKCGIALDPEVILPRLQELAHNGFELKLPRALFRKVSLPGGLRQEVAVEERRVELMVKASALHVTPETLWFGATVRSRVSGAPAPP